ncbi:hypothetical protein ACFO5R_21850 [Halosolutus amylolyticus]|uniref:SipW-cognate class signal peptide n=1 Tax=Halosolutus amylolyticus TaxID=2932267 RepID=A0ABD5PVC8_9EURY|nr:hypothetical protein [Halosolutus amylolyticus]
MADDRPGITRRRLLAGVAVGSGGLATNGATTSLLSDAERVGAVLTTGALDLRIDWELVDGPNAGETGRSDGRFDLPIAYDGHHRRGAAVLEIGPTERTENNPADLWLRGTCPDSGSLGTFGEVARLTLSYANCETGDPLPGGELTAGSFRDVFDILARGIALDGGRDPDAPIDGRECVAPGDAVCLRVKWDIAGYVGDESAAPSLAVVGRQCRHTDRSAPPFDPAPPCPPADPCPCCLDVGKLELEADGPAGIGENRIEPGTYAFSEGASRYELRVTDVADKPDSGDRETVAIAFDIVDEDGHRGPALCRVDVAGGRDPDGTGPAIETYEPPVDGPFENTTGALEGSDGDGLVYAPRRDSGDDSPEYYGISHVTIAICAAEGGCH